MATELQAMGHGGEPTSQEELVDTPRVTLARLLDLVSLLASSEELL